MQICGKYFTSTVLDKIRETVSQTPSISRNVLSRLVCGWLDWRSPSGNLQEMSARKALGKLHDRGVIELPRCKQFFTFQQSTPKDVDLTLPELSCDLADLREITVTPVTSRYAKDSKIWNAMMTRYHPLGSGPLCGAQIRYLVKSKTHGYLGALSFSAASWALADRDRFIGWSDGARRANLGLVVNNSRFLILPGVKVKNLASHTLALAVARLPGDWEQRYGIRPLLAETYVDPSHFAGTCYKAANWIHVGHTSGRRDDVAKMIFLLPLDRRWEWQKGLCAEPAAMELGQVPRPESPAHWAEEEFGTVRLHDSRLKERLYTIAQDFYGRPCANITEACGSHGRAKGAYRFFQNEKVTMDVLLTAHTEATIDRIRQHRVVLAPQDTTTLNYSTHPMTEGLGPTGNIADKAVGLLLHDTLAFSEEGTPLGVLDAQCWARDPKNKGKSSRRRELPIEQKESYKWLRSFNKVSSIQKLCPETTLVSIGDREADIYELFAMATSPDAPRLLVRMEKTRNRQVEEQHLWDFMTDRKIAGELMVHIPRRGANKGRDAWMDIRYAEVQLTPPKRLVGSHKPIRVWAVYLLEQGEGLDNAVEWMLLTTAEVHNFTDAVKRVEWYAGRWGIELYHRVLKSGCRIEDRQLGTVNRLEVCLGIDMVVAWRIYHLTMLGRETPDVPCSAFFTDVEWKALCCYVHRTPDAPEAPPSMKEAVRMIGSLGGHLGRKRDGPPGAQVLWRGLERLDTAKEMYAIFRPQPPPPLAAPP
jgi:hypothetical protein